MKLLIVDDEHYIVNHLTSIISEHFDAQLEVEHAYSGVSALKIIENTKIDLILLDIHMPGITGLEVAQTLIKMLPRCKIMFLTAYDNFEYIYKVSGMPNVSYLLKTESDETILAEIQKNIATIVDEQKKLTILDEATQKSFLLNHLLLQQPLREIIVGSPLELIKGELAFLEEDFFLNLEKPFYIMYMQVRQKHRKSTKQNPLLHTVQYLQLADRLLCNKFSYGMLELENFCYVWFFQPEFSTSSESAPFTLLRNMADELSGLSFSTLRRNTILTLYPEAILFPQVCEVYSKLCSEAELHMISSDNFSSVVMYKERPQESPDGLVDKSSMDKYYQELSFHLYQRNNREFFQTLSDIQSQCGNIYSMHNLSIIKVYNTVSLLLINYIDLYQIQASLASKTAIYPLYYLNDFSNWQQAFSYITQCASHIFKLGELKTADKIDSIIAKIKHYINVHLDENLTLATLSSIVNYNETYISRLFRQSTGTKLSDYIHDQRILKAKELLTNSSHSMSQIATLVGFDTAQYFSIVFKKAVGMSPSDYRRMQLR